MSFELEDREILHLAFTELRLQYKRSRLASTSRPGHQDSSRADPLSTLHWSDPPSDRNSYPPAQHAFTPNLHERTFSLLSARLQVSSSQTTPGHHQRHACPHAHDESNAAVDSSQPLGYWPCDASSLGLRGNAVWGAAHFPLATPRSREPQMRGPSSGKNCMASDR